MRCDDPLGYPLTSFGASLFDGFGCLVLGDQPAPPSGQLRPITYQVYDYGVPPAS